MALSYSIRHIYYVLAMTGLVVGCNYNSTNVLRENDGASANKHKIYLRAYVNGQLYLYTKSDNFMDGLVICRPNEANKCDEHNATDFNVAGNYRDGKILYGVKVSVEPNTNTDFLIATRQGAEFKILRSFDLIPKNNKYTQDDSTKASGQFTGKGVYGQGVKLPFTSKGNRQSSYFVYAPQNNGENQAHPLLVYLHGDGAGEVDSYLPQFQNLAKKHQLVFISVIAPSGGDLRWYRDPQGNTEYLDDLIQREVYSKYNIRKSKVFFTGASGGSQFITGAFIPLVGNNYRGGALPMCGGGGPQGFGQYFNRFQPTQDLAANFKIIYYTGTADFLVSQVQDSEKSYRSRGFTTKGIYPQGVAHCGFNLANVLDDLVTQAITP